MATMNQRTAMVQIPAGVLAHLCMAADSGAFDAAQLWGFTQVALQPYWIATTTQTNGAAGNAVQANQQEGAGRRNRQVSNAASTKSNATQGTRTRAARSGSRREQLISLIRANPVGMSRAELLRTLGIKGDKSGEMSVSNALTSMKKGNLIYSNSGKYFATENTTAEENTRQLVPV